MLGIEYLLLLQQLRERTGGVLDSFFVSATHLGGSTILIMTTLLFYLCIDKETGSYLMLNGLFGLVFNNFLKICFCVYRPWILDPRIKPLEAALPKATGYSFPSGHATGATAVWGSLAVRYHKKRGLAAIGIAIVVIVAFSRNYVGVHTPQDVLVAVLLGIILLYITDRLYRMFEKKPKRDLAFAIVVIFFSICLLLYAKCKNYPLDMLNGRLIADPEIMKLDTFAAGGGAIGFVTGWLLERRKIRFTIEGGIVRRILRFVLGMGSVLLVKELSEQLVGCLLPADWGAALSMGVLIFWLVAGLPFCVKTMNNVLHCFVDRRMV